MESVEQLAQKAVNLQPVERLQLIEAILYSLDKIDPEIEQNWVAEAEERYDAYQKGTLKAIEWENIKKRYQQ